MSTRYGDRGFGRYGDPEDDRAEERDYERGESRGYGETGGGFGRGADYGAARRGGRAAARGGDYDYGRDYGYGREYGSRLGSREYGAGEHAPRYGRERLTGGYTPPPQRRHEGEDYGRVYGRDYERGRARAHEDEGVRDYDTDYGRTTSRFYGRSGYEYGREDYDRDDDDRAALRGRSDDRGDEGRSWLDRAADGVRSWFGGDDAEHGRRGDEMRARGGQGRGRFRGRGPRNYHRSDERVREEVCDRLTDNEWLDASDVEVNVVAAEVILTGTVDSRYAKRLAENIADSVSGVANVQNNLRVHNYQAAGLDTTVTAVAPAAGASDITAAPAAPESDLGDTPPGRTSSRAAGKS